MASAQATTILERLIDDDAVHEQLVAGGARIRDAYRRARRLPAHKAVQDPTLYDQLRGAAGALTEAARRLAGKPKPKPEPPRRARRLAMLIGVAVTAGAFYFARRADQAASRQDAGTGRRCAAHVRHHNGARNPVARSAGRHAAPRPTPRARTPTRSPTTRPHHEEAVMTDTKEILSWRGQQLHDRDGEKVGKIEEIYLDAETEQPEWALVNTGLFGSKSTFVPLRDAGAEGDAVRVPYAKDQIKDAPRIDADGELSQREEAELYRHYGLQYSQARSDSGLAEGSARTSAPTTSGERADTTTADDRDVLRDRAGTSGAERDAGGTSTSASGQRAADEDRTVRDDSAALGGDDTDTDADTAMTRSEEELRVGTRQRETGRARLRKYIVTEDVEETVPVRREEARVESEPITDDNVEQAMSGPDLSEAEHEVTLREEEPVAEKRTVPKERVRLDTDTVTDEREVSETVRKERVEIDDDSERRDG